MYVNFLFFHFFQEIDLRIGASFTRFQTMLLRDAFVIDSATDDRNLVLSYGPCQVWWLLTINCTIMWMWMNCTIISNLYYNLEVAILMHLPFYLLFEYSSLHLALLWKDIGRCKHMSQKNFGQSTAPTNQMKALLLSIGCKASMPWWLHVYFDVQLPWS